MPWFAIFCGFEVKTTKGGNGMEHSQTSRKGKHLTREERIVIERNSRGGIPPREIARILGRHQRTIEREMKRGRVKHIDTELREKYVYSSDRGQDVHDLNATAKGPNLKIGHNHATAEYIRWRIVELRESPDVVAHRMKKAGMAGAVCTKTLYNYIDQNIIPGVGNQSLWEKRKRRKRRKKGLRRLAKRIAKGSSIEQRPAEAESRQVFGHWEMDLIVGPTRGSCAALLTLTERKYRQTIIRKLPDQTQKSVLRALRGIERSYGPRRFRKIFKTITVDNGSEFLNFKTIEASSFSKQQRTRLFYAHPYAAWERGSNENANKMIRRFVAKGRDIAFFNRQTINEIETWINNYPRRILEFLSPNELFYEQLKVIA